MCRRPLFGTATHLRLEQAGARPCCSLPRHGQSHPVRPSWGAQVYGCVFEEDSATDGESDKLLMYSWAWSVMQRFAVNEPALIGVGVMMPMLFATECCANLCTESANNVLGVAVAMLITFFKRMRRA